MLFSTEVNRFRQNVVVIIFLVLVWYAPNVLTRNDQIVSNAIEQSKQNASMKKQSTFVEYYIEHNVSQGDAKRSFFDVGIKLLDGACCDNFSKKKNHVKKRKTNNNIFRRKKMHFN